MSRIPLPGTGFRTLLGPVLLLKSSRVANTDSYSMNPRGRLISYGWVPVLLVAAIFLLWTKSASIERVEYLTNLEVEVEVDPSSPTGYAGGRRALIVPEHNNNSYQWVMQAQQMLADDDWLITEVDYDNAPIGREVRSPSVYRWWLATVAVVGNLFSDLPAGLSVERAALHADAAAQFLFLVALACLAAWRFGWFPAAVFAAGWTFLFPLSGAFLPGAPDDHGLSQIFIVLSLLPLLPGKFGVEAPRQRRFFFFAAGVAGGIGVWINPGVQLPILLGVALGGIAGSFVGMWHKHEKTATPPEALPWRAWTFGGAAMCVLAYLIESAPDRMDVMALRFQVVHPVFALVWLGAGELLSRLDTRIRTGRSAWKVRDIIVVVLSVLAVLSLPGLSLLRETGGIGVSDPFENRLTNLPNGPVAENFADWYLRQGATAMIVAIVLPLVFILPALWLICRKNTGPIQRVALAILFGPVMVALVFAFLHLRWWNMVDSALLVLLLAVVSALPVFGSIAKTRAVCAVIMFACLLPGIIQLIPPAGTRGLSAVETISLLERNLAHQLAIRSGEERTIVLAPPNLTTSVMFHGGLRGLGSPFWENHDGFVASVRVAGATSPDEGHALAEQREVRYIVIPNWDSFLEEYASLGGSDPGYSIIGMLKRWHPPRWIRPVPFYVPEIDGAAGYGAVIFETGEVQNNANALSRLAEYFVETEQLQLAATLTRALEESYPSDLSVLVARAQVAFAQQDGRTFRNIMDLIVAQLSETAEDSLPWDRRVSLALMLAQAREIDLALEHAGYCLDEADDYLLRSLSPAALYRFRLLIKALGMEPPDPETDGLIAQLLPKELRNRMQESL